MPPLKLNTSMSLPVISGTESIDELARKLATFLIKSIHRPANFENFKGAQGRPLKSLCSYLLSTASHPELVAVLMALTGHFAALESEDLDGVNAARSAACEYVAVRYVSNMGRRELIDCLLIDTSASAAASTPVESHESSPLLGHSRARIFSSPVNIAEDDVLDSPAPERINGLDTSRTTQASLFDELRGLNTLEIAAVSGAKKFLGSKTVQAFVTAIWDGDIIFWSSLSSSATKRAQIYKAPAPDPFSRLRVPKYLKVFEALFFLAFLVLYYAVLMQRSFQGVTVAEVVLYIWVASFAYNELGEYMDAGTAFYLSDFWTLWDVAIVLNAAAFLTSRVIGLAKHDPRITDISFDILALEALFLVPRLFSLLSLHPYFGTLLPCLRDMTRDFLKFLSLVVILYFGFLTTFSLLARDHFTFREMSWILIKVFFGSSYLGFDVAEKISPALGPPLMLVFVCLTNILLITSLISLLSNTLTKVIEHAADEYKFVYSVYVLEASTSNRLTYFLPPLNLIPLVLRPLRLVLSASQLRHIRIMLLRASHFPHVVAIQIYEILRSKFGRLKSGAGTDDIAAVTPDRDRSVSKRYSRYKRLSMPQPLAAEILKPALLVRDEQEGTGVGDDTLPADAIEAIKALESTVAHLTRQVAALTAANRSSGGPSPH